MPLPERCLLYLAVSFCLLLLPFLLLLPDLGPLVCRLLQGIIGSFSLTPALLLFSRVLSCCHVVCPSLLSILHQPLS